MSRMILAAAIAGLLAAPAAASPQLRALVEQHLPAWGYAEVDMSTLSTAQVAQIHHIMFSDRAHGEKEKLIESVLRGGYQLLRGDSVL